MDSATSVRVFAGLLFIAVIVAVTLPPYWMIFKKAGFSPWLALTMLVPLVNVIVLYVVAFSTWRVVPTAPPFVQPLPPQG
ncbi:MAG TPA: hypothetical protein VMV39_04620 [Terracidiphilus sp.]|nr:hypothetical protein [Terracidiphilus sp.]